MNEVDFLQDFLHKKSYFIAMFLDGYKYIIIDQVPRAQPGGAKGAEASPFSQVKV